MGLLPSTMVDYQCFLPVCEKKEKNPYKKIKIHVWAKFHQCRKTNEYFEFNGTKGSNGQIIALTNI